MGTSTYSGTAEGGQQVAAPRRTIPQIRARLLELVAELRDPEGLEYEAIADEIEAMCEESKRRFGGRRASPRRKSLDPELASRIQSYAARAPGASYTEIAEHLHTNIGRVSEALTGFRGERN